LPQKPRAPASSIGTRERIIDAVVALLAAGEHVLPAHRGEALERQLLDRALGLLQAEDVGPLLVQQPPHEPSRWRTELMFQVATMSGIRAILLRRPSRPIPASAQS
jgi:hypothetical protein